MSITKSIYFNLLITEKIKMKIENVKKLKSQLIDEKD